MSLVSKSDTGSHFANFSYWSSFPCRAHSASCRGCASVNKMENFARRLRPRPPYPVYFLSPRQEPAAAFTLPVFRRSSDTDPRPETTRRQTRQTRLPIFLTQLRHWHRHRQQDKQDFQFLDAGQTQTHAQRQPGDEENKQDSYFNASSGLWVLFTQSFHINQYSAGLPSSAYISFQTLGRHQQSQNRTRF